MPGRNPDDFDLDTHARVLEAYLVQSDSHRRIQKQILGLPAPPRGGGFVAMDILHSYDIKGDKKGKLRDRSVDEELVGATEPYRSALLLVKGSSEYRTEVRQAIAVAETEWHIPVGPTEIDTRTKRRIAQDCLREAVLSNYGKCALCDVAEADLLVCSHIVPWAMDERNRLNPSNAICLCAWHDCLFDRGYFSLDPEMRIVVSERAPDYIWEQLHKLEFTFPLNAAPSLEFVEYHRQNILR